MNLDDVQRLKPGDLIVWGPYNNSNWRIHGDLRTHPDRLSIGRVYSTKKKTIAVRGGPLSDERCVCFESDPWDFWEFNRVHFHGYPCHIVPYHHVVFWSHGTGQIPLSDEPPEMPPPLPEMPKIAPPLVTEGFFYVERKKPPKDPALVEYQRIKALHEEYHRQMSNLWRFDWDQARGYDYDDEGAF